MITISEIGQEILDISESIDYGMLTHQAMSIGTLSSLNDWRVSLAKKAKYYPALVSKSDIRKAYLDIRCDLEFQRSMTQ